MSHCQGEGKLQAGEVQETLFTDVVMSVHDDVTINGVTVIFHASVSMFLMHDYHTKAKNHLKHCCCGMENGILLLFLH